MNIEAAQDYAERHSLQALIIDVCGEIAFERYEGGYDVAKAHALYSGTKSFWGVVAVAAQVDGLLELDECVAKTFPAWADDERKRLITLRELLQLTSGIGFGGLGNGVPTYAKALDVAIKDAPGERFTYGGIPLQVFGAVLAAKLAPRNLSPHDYLRARILDPIGVSVASWRTLQDGTQPLPTGAFMTARSWLRYGLFILGGGSWNGATILAPESLAQCFAGSAPNPHYGLGWHVRSDLGAGEVVYASGAGGQGLYIIPSEQTVVVKFGNSSSYDHLTFLKRLLGHVRPHPSARATSRR
jgi:CubicO group peptidase (beta-lactamase class C family)